MNEETVTPQMSSDASLLSASELPASISTSTPAEDETSAEPTPSMNETVPEEPIPWVDILGNKQLMKRVCLSLYVLVLPYISFWHGVAVI